MDYPASCRYRRQTIATIANSTAERFVYRHGYRRNDVVIWDNSQLLHCAERLERSRAPEQDRIMHRVSVRGWPK